LKIGNLVTWKVDYEESISKPKVVNLDLEVGIVIEEKKLQAEIDFVYVCWFQKTGNQGWVPVDNLEILQYANSK
jgi:hypothetical protein